MKKRLQGLIAGLLIGAVVAGGAAYADQAVKIVIDGHELIPTDANGNRVDPVIIDGTTYLPVRAIANAFGKPVYWDGPNYTVYLGDMDGQLQYPSVLLKDMDNIGGKFGKARADELIDNYGNSYSSAIYGYDFVFSHFETVLNMKYSRFRCVLYTPKGDNGDDSTRVLIKTDGKIVYSSPEITKTSRPINVDVDVTGCNIFEIEVTGCGYKRGFIGDGGFYQ